MLHMMKIWMISVMLRIILKLIDWKQSLLYWLTGRSASTLISVTTHSSSKTTQTSSTPWSKCTKLKEMGWCKLHSIKIIWSTVIKLFVNNVMMDLLYYSKQLPIFGEIICKIAGCQGICNIIIYVRCPVIRTCRFS